MIEIFQIFAALLLKIIAKSDHRGSSFLPSPAAFALLVAKNYGRFGVLTKLYHENVNFLRIKIHELVYLRGSANPEDRGHLQAPVSPRERSIQKQIIPARF